MRSRKLPVEGTPQGIVDGGTLMDRSAQTGSVLGSAVGIQEGEHRDPKLINESLPIDPRGPQVWRTASLNLAIKRETHG